MRLDATRLPALALWGTEIGLWDWSIPDDRLQWINNWCELAGLADFSGQGHERLWTQRMHPDDLPAYQNALAQHMQGLTAVFDVEYRLRDRKDSWVWIQERGRIIEHDAAGRALRMVGLCLDIDERRRTAHALGHSEARIELAMRATDFGFWHLDVAADEIHWWNDWCERFDIDPCVGKGHVQRWDARIHPDDLASQASYEGLVAGRCELYEAEYRIRTLSGGWRWMLSRGRATDRDSAGKVLRVTGVSVDIDARRRAELALRESEARLEATIWGAGIGLWESDTQGDFVWFNDWCASLDIDPCDGHDALACWREQRAPGGPAASRPCQQRLAQRRDGFLRRRIPYPHSRQPMALAPRARPGHEARCDRPGAACSRRLPRHRCATPRRAAAAHAGTDSRDHA